MNKKLPFEVQPCAQIKAFYRCQPISGRLKYLGIALPACALLHGFGLGQPAEASPAELATDRDIAQTPIITVRNESVVFTPALIASPSVSNMAAMAAGVFDEPSLSRYTPGIRVSKLVSPRLIEVAAPAAGQQVSTSMTSQKDDLKKLQTRLEALDVRLLSLPDLRQSLGLSINTPTAFGGSEGASALTFGYQQLRPTTGSDVIAGAVTSFGRPTKVGLDVAFNLLDLSKRNGGGFAKRGSLSLKAHRRVAQDFAIAFGADNLLDYGNNGLQGPSYYGVVSTGVHLKSGASDSFSDLYLTLGVGTNRFRSESRFLADKGTFGVFGSAALKVNNRCNVFTEWTGQDLNVGVALQPFRKVPLIITPALADLTGKAGKRTRFLVGVSYLLPVGSGKP